MKTTRLVLSSLLIVSSALAAGPINDVCPVKGKPIRLIFRTKTKDGVVAFCCEECKDAFERSPTRYTVTRKKGE
jgi:hypothetical protein